MSVNYQALIPILISAMRYYKYGENKYLDKLLGFCKSNDCKKPQDDDIDLENSNEDNINQSNKLKIQLQWKRSFVNKPDATNGFTFIAFF